MVMLSVIDVIKSLTLLVESNFPNYPVNDRDIEEGFPRPSYYIDIEEVRGENVTATFVKEEADLQLYFMAEDRYSGFLELLIMKNQLLNLLSKPLALVDDSGNEIAHVVFNNVSVVIDKDDKALQCTMTSELIQARENDDTKDDYIIEHVDINTIYGKYSMEKEE